MKAYRVYWKSATTDFQRTDDKAKYFFNEEEAKKFYNTGKYFEEEIRVWEKYKSGNYSTSYFTIGKTFIDRYIKEEAKVKIVKIEKNKFEIEEIEIN